MRPEQILFPMVRWVAARPKLASALIGRFDPWGNPFTDEVVANPMLLAENMRKDAPLHWHPMYRQWFVMGYDEAREILGSPSVGTKNQMDVLLSVSPYPKLSDRTRALLSNLMLVTDPPQHTRLRSLVNRAFTPRQVTRLEEPMAELADELIGAFRHEVELMHDFAVKFPALVIGELIGFDRDEADWVRDISTTLTQTTEPLRYFDVAEVDAAAHDLYQRITDLVERRRRNPADDLITALALAEDEDNDRLSVDELFGTIGLLLIAGHETTSSMIGMSVLHLHDNPDQLALLEQRPELWPNAIEELLRYDPALRTDPRTALEDFVVAGKTIKKGDNLVVITQLANRDFRRFEDADDLRVDREDPAPLTFGHGIHFCLGAALARAELRIAMPRLLAALKGYTIDASKVTWRDSLALRGPAHFPISRHR